MGREVQSDDFLGNFVEGEDISYRERVDLTISFDSSVEGRKGNSVNHTDQTDKIIGSENPNIRSILSMMDDG